MTNDLELWLTLLLVFLGGLMLMHVIAWIAGALRRRQAEKRMMEYIWRRQR
jgi:hypothetical protein